MITDANGKSHCKCKYCGGVPKLIHGVLNDFIQCDDCSSSFQNWDEWDECMNSFQDKVVTMNDIVKNGDITNWDHPYGISYKKLNEIKPVEVSTEVVRHGYWLSREKHNDYLWAECSECGFRIENYKAVEIGTSDTDYIGVKWKRCPICEAKMHIKPKKGNT